MVGVVANLVDNSNGDSFWPVNRRCFEHKRIQRVAVEQLKKMES